MAITQRYVARGRSYRAVLRALVRKAWGAGESRQLKDPFAGSYTLGRAIQPPLPLEQLLALTEVSPIHAACIEAKVADAVGRGWEWVPAGDDSEFDAQEMDAILEDITPDWTFQELVRQAAWELEALGWSAWEIVRNDKGQVAAIYPLPGHTLRATPDPRIYVQMRMGQLRYFAAFGSGLNLDPRTGQEADLPPEERASEVLVFRYYNPRSPFYGLPRWIAALPTIAELVAIRDYNLGWYESSGTPDRWIHIKAPTPEEGESLADALTQQLEQARGRAHVTIITYASSETEGEVKFLAPLPQGRREASFLQRREDLVKELLMAHQVPPYRVGWAELGSLGGSAAREMLRAYRAGVVEPIQTVLESRIDRLLGEDGLNLPARLRFSDVDWEERELDAQVVERLVGAAVLTPNEGREWLGYSPADDPALNMFYLKGQPIGQVPEEKALDLAGQAVRELERALRAALDGHVPT
jgi:capsid portal protein